MICIYTIINFNPLSMPTENVSKQVTNTVLWWHLIWLQILMFWIYTYPLRVILNNKESTMIFAVTPNPTLMKYSTVSHTFELLQQQFIDSIDTMHPITDTFARTKFRICCIPASSDSIVNGINFILTHLPLVPHICVSELGRHWFT